MRIKVLVEKSFKQSSSLPHSSADAHSLLNTAPVVQRERDRNDGDVQVKVQKKQCLFRAQLQQTTTVKLSSCVGYWQYR